ncbi:hypothetical protein ACQCQ7_19630, partial [Ralstonia pseudosolanacearum]|uniref:hypothetical protein n=1 Tax=Ralstonia pseudosolanacearum TaxID=1310165 RepID=UPI003CE7EA74
MSAHPTWRDVLTDGILAERHGADLLFGSAAVRALETAAYRALAPFTLMARAGSMPERIRFGIVLLPNFTLTAFS